MAVEVELKYSVAGLDDLEKRLSTMGIVPGMCQEERDLYFSHPVRDFAQTDEALRLRRVGIRNRITYKGPKLDTISKTRHELDLALPDGEGVFCHWCALLEALGFRPVAEVVKRRKKGWTEWEGWRVEISLDEVENVGHYVEFEIICDTEQVPQARDALLRLAKAVELSNSERRSYLELLLLRKGLAGQGAEIG